MPGGHGRHRGNSHERIQHSRSRRAGSSPRTRSASSTWSRTRRCTTSSTAPAASRASSGGVASSRWATKFAHEHAHRAAVPDDQQRRGVHRGSTHRVGAHRRVALALRVRADRRGSRRRLHARDRDLRLVDVEGRRVRRSSCGSPTRNRRTWNARSHASTRSSRTPPPPSESDVTGTPTHATSPRSTSTARSPRATRSSPFLRQGQRADPVRPGLRPARPARRAADGVDAARPRRGEGRDDPPAVRRTERGRAARAGRALRAGPAREPGCEPDVLRASGAAPRPTATRSCSSRPRSCTTWSRSPRSSACTASSRSSRPWTDGRLTGALTHPNVRAEQKAVRLREWMGQPATGPLHGVELWAYGNSSGDHALLQLADHRYWRGRPNKVPAGSELFAPGPPEDRSSADLTDPLRAVHPARGPRLTQTHRAEATW